MGTGTRQSRWRRRLLLAAGSLALLGAVACGGDDTPEPTETPTSTMTATATPSLTPSPVPTPSVTATPTSTPETTPTATPTIEPTAEPPPIATAAPPPPQPTNPPAPPPPPASGHIAEIRGFGYPYQLTVSAGSTVTWINHDQAPHDAVAYDGAFTSPMLGQGQSWSFTFATPGTYAYYCTVHPYMQAMVVVQ